MTDPTTPQYPDIPIVLFDGECHLCDWSVRFILKHERDHEIRFAPLQSAVGRSLLPQDESQIPDSVVYVINGDVRFCSDAAVSIARHLKTPWRWLGLIGLLPRLIRDALYRMVAGNRYRLFGRKDACEIPTPLTRDRQLTEEDT